MCEIEGILSQGSQTENTHRICKWKYYFRLTSYFIVTTVPIQGVSHSINVKINKKEYNYSKCQKFILFTKMC